jgi:purine-binding chemotaxis protein CheW
MMDNQANEGGKKYLTFRLVREYFGIDILKVREIVGRMDITAVPQAAAHIKGVVNLRGKIIPVMDLRLRFGLPEGEITRENCIITVQVQGRDGLILVGLLVDAVSEVLGVSDAEVEPVPDMGGDLDVKYVKGLAKTKGKVTILLDIECVVNGADGGAVEAAIQAAQSDVLAGA